MAIYLASSGSHNDKSILNEAAIFHEVLNGRIDSLKKDFEGDTKNCATTV